MLQWHHLDMDVTPAQCRAARSLLGISQDELSIRSRVSKRAIAGFEVGQSRPVPATLMALRQALEAAGVEFIPGGARLREPAETGS
jgi:transcriptional regulator with XRE-family HTH domain